MIQTKGTQPMVHKPIQIGRKLAESDEFLTWLAHLPFPTSDPKNMHATVAYSRKGVDWTHPTFQEIETDLTVFGGGRSVEYLDEGVMVLRFTDLALELRWRELLSAGASWDYKYFLPHITISRTLDFNLESVSAFEGPLKFGPEYRKNAK